MRISGLDWFSTMLSLAWKPSWYVMRASWRWTSSCAFRISICTFCTSARSRSTQVQ